MEFKSEFTINDAFTRLEKGYFCYVAKKNEDLIAYLWIATKDFRIPYFDGIIILKENVTAHFTR